MKVKLTAKFSAQRVGKVIEVSDVTGNDLIKEGKATKVGSNAKDEKPAKEKEAKTAKDEAAQDEPKTDAKNIEIE